MPERPVIPPPVLEPGPRTARSTDAILWCAIALAVVAIVGTAAMLVWLIAEGRI